MTENPTSLKAPLTLSDIGSFHVGGQLRRISHTGMALESLTACDGAMYVRYMIPAERKHALPIVLVHGGLHTGVCWETTPDGREGWETMLVSAGFAVYNVDQPWRGRSGFDASPINAARENPAAASELPAVAIGGTELIGLLTRDGQRFPYERLDQYAAQFAADFYMPIAATHSRPGESDPRALAAMLALLEKIGPAILLTHSQGGEVGWLTALHAPEHVRAIVSVEPGVGCEILDREDFPDIPVYVMWGDNLEAEGPLNCLQLDACKTLASKRRQMTVDHLPDAGIFGNSHMLMMEDNNRELIGRIVDWLCKVPGQ